MIVPLATNTNEHVHDYMSNELLENCFPVFNESTAEFPVTVCMRRGCSLAEAAAGDYMGYARQNIGDYTYAGVFLFTDKCVHTDHVLNNTTGTFAPIGTVTSNPVADSQAVYYGTTDGIRRYEWGTGHTHQIMTGKVVTKLAILNRYMWAYVPAERKVFISAYSDFTDFSELNYIRNCDYEISHMIVYNDEMWIFRSDDKIKIFSSDPSVSPPFAQVPGATIDIMPDSALKPLVESDMLFFVGADHNLYVVSGYQPQKISGLAVRRSTPIQGDLWLDISTADTGARRFVCVTTDSGVWCVDIETGAWWKRTGIEGNGGCVEFVVKSGEGVYLQGGDDDNGADIQRRIVSPPFHTERQLFSVNSLGFGASAGSTWTVSTSRDGGSSYPINRSINLEPLPERNRLYRFGAARSHVVKLESITAPADEKISGMEIL